MERRFDGAEEELGGLPFEATTSGDATPSPSTVALTATLPSATPNAGSTPTTAPIAVPITLPSVIATGSGDAAAFPAAIGLTITVPTATPNAGSTPAPSALPLVVSMPAVTATASSGATPTPSTIALAVSMVSPFATGDDVLGLWMAQATLFPDRIGVSVLADSATDAHAVVAGVSSRPAGAAAVLTDDYGFRGLYGFSIDTDTPGNFPVDGRDWVLLGSWGDFSLACRRNYGNAFDLRVDWETAAAASAYATTSFTVDDYASIGFAATRDAGTGTITLWRSDDGWDTWTEMPLSSYAMPTGALNDSIGEPLTLLSGDLQDGPWVQVFAAQWAETTVLGDFDTDEVTAWQYGSNLVTGVGGDFFDGFDGDTKDLFDHAGRSSYAYKLRYQTTLSGTSRRVDWTVNAPTLATGTPTAGTEAAFVYDMTPQWSDGPTSTSLLPPVLFDSASQLDIHNFGYSPSGAGFGTYTAAGQRPRWRATLCEMDGTPQVQLENAMIRPVTWSLNERPTWEIDMPILDPQLAEIARLPYQEVQIWRGDRLIEWGPMVRARDNGSAGTVTYQCQGSAWYFKDRHVGVSPPNFLVDGSFEQGIGWRHGAYHLFEPVAKRNPAYWSSEITSERFAAGTPGRSLKLTSTDDMTFGIASSQFIWHTIDPATRPDGIVWTASAWAYVPSDEWVSERTGAYTSDGASAPFGLSLLRLSTDTWVPVEAPDVSSLPKLIDANVASIDEDFPKDTWVRLEVSITSPADATPRTDWIQVDLHCPIGTVYWDQVQLVRDERLFFDDVDQATIVQQLVEHAQDTSLGKSDLNISTNCPLTGVLRSRTYPWFNHLEIDEAIDEFPSLWNGLDWAVKVSKETRTFTTYYPMKGTRRPAHPLLGGKNIADVIFAEDGANAYTDVTMIADTDQHGSGRDEVRISSTEFSGGVTLEGVAHAAKESPLSSLVDQAGQAWRVAQDMRIPTIVTYEGKGAELFGAIEEGDVVYVNVTKGYRSLVGWFRVMAYTVDPETEKMSFVVNPFDDYLDPTVQQVAVV